jgi:hypothetical protein
MVGRRRHRVRRQPGSLDLPAWAGLFSAYRPLPWCGHPPI